MTPALHRLPGPVSQIRGTAAGIPQHLRGQPRLVIDSLMRGADLDLSGSAADFQIEGRTWTTANTKCDDAIAGLSGTRMHSSDAADCYFLTTEIPGMTDGSLICAAVEFSIDAWVATNSSIQVRLGQAAAGDTNTTEDFVSTVRKTGASAWRPKPGYRASSSFPLVHCGDNPWESSIPSRVVMQIVGHGNTWVSTFSTAAGRPSFDGLVATNNGSGRTITRSGGTVNGATPALCKWLKICCCPNGSSLDFTVVGVRVWRLG